MFFGKERARMKQPRVLVVDESQADGFERRCASLLEKGYKMAACSCGFIPSEQYDFCLSLQAVMVYELTEQDKKENDLEMSRYLAHMNQAFTEKVER